MCQTAKESRFFSEKWIKKNSFGFCRQFSNQHIHRVENSEREMHAWKKCSK